MKKFTIFIALVLLSLGAMAQVNLTFNRTADGVVVNVDGTDGVEASVVTNVEGGWLVGGAMASRTDVLTPSRNTSQASEGNHIIYTFTISGLAQGKAFSAAKFTNIAVNSAGNLQPSNDIDIRHCNFVLYANQAEVASIADQNIWIAAGQTEREIVLENTDFAADEEGNLVIVLDISKGTSNNGCFYGLTKLELTEIPAEPTDPTPGEGEGEEGGAEPTDPTPGEGEDADGDTTGVSDVKSQQDLVIYDLLGRRVAKMGKGIYIVNGKKVMVK